MRVKLPAMILGLALTLGVADVSAQTTEFTYQGRLTVGGVAATSPHDFEFRLFTAPTGGTQIGSTLSRLNVPVVNGVFTVPLDFGEQFDGTDRWLRIDVRPVGGTTFQPLTPLQRITSAPYNIKSRSAASADVALNASQLGGVAANQYVVTTDPRMTDPRTPLAGSADYIQNRTTQQSLSNFNVSGTGTASIFSAATQYNIGGDRILSNPGFNNLFAGFATGNANTTGTQNSFFGANSGQSNTTAGDNSFFGTGSGSSNTTGGSNSFFGALSGILNTTGGSNSFFGTSSGLSNTTGSNNTIIGNNANVGSGNLNFATAIGAGSVVSTSNTIALGRSGGQDTVSISGNGLVGGTFGVGTSPVSAKLHVAGTDLYALRADNTFVGAGSSIGVFGRSVNNPGVGMGGAFTGGNTGVQGTADATTFNGNAFGVVGSATGSAGLRYGVIGTATGTGSTTNFGVFGGAAGGTTNWAGYFDGNTHVAGNLGIATTAPTQRLHVVGNGLITGDLTVSGILNANLPITGNYIQNTTTQQATSNFNISGTGTASILNAATQFQIAGQRVLNSSLNNLSVGFDSGSTSGGGDNAFFGNRAGFANVNGTGNAFFGSKAGDSNDQGGQNSFFGAFAGDANTSREGNSFFGYQAGFNNLAGGGNSFFGRQAGGGHTGGDLNAFFGASAGFNSTTGNNNTLIGAIADVSTGGLSNATAIGARALVAQSNSLILGSISGVNGATSDTNVGIGTTAPGARLTVTASSTNSGDNTARFQAPNIGPNLSHIHFGTTGDWFIRSAANNGKVILQDSGGNVGIGTNAPTFKLQIIDSSNTGLRVQTNLVGGTVASFGGSGAFQIDASGVNGGRLHVAEDGNVGIGTNTPATKLHVIGSITTGLISGGATSLCVNAVNTIALCSSSLRYKQNIVGFGSGLDLINRLRPVTFNWKADNKADMGLVAEEVAAVEPLLATYNDKGEVEGVKYDRVGVVAVNAIKEQQTQIEAQAAKIGDQQTQIKSQQNQITDQQMQIELLKKQVVLLRGFVCAQNPTAEVCKEERK